MHNKIDYGDIIKLSINGNEEQNFFVQISESENKDIWDLKNMHPSEEPKTIQLQILKQIRGDERDKKSN